MREKKYAQEYKIATANLIKAKIDLCSALLIFIFSFIILFMSIFTLNFIEAFMRGIGIVTGALMLVLNKRIKSLERMKFLAYLLSCMVIILITAYSFINKNFFVVGIIHYLVMMFTLSLIFPWTFKDLFLLGSFNILGFVSAVAVRGGVGDYTFYVATSTFSLFIALFVCVFIKGDDETRRKSEFMLKKEVEDKNRAIEQELELAKNIHKSLIPESISTDVVDIMVTYKPMYYIGGDYAKFYFIDRSRLLFIISDITGHGVSAALLVNRMHTETERLVRENKNPGLLLKELDKFIKQGFYGTGMYLSAFCGVLDFAKQQLFYSNYGHPPQYLYHIEKRKLNALNSQTRLLGLPLEDDQTYEGSVDFEKGDRMLLFTDGLIETRGVNSEEYGIQRLESFIADNRNLPMGEFNQNLLDDLNLFRKGEISDDVFILLIDIKKKASFVAEAMKTILNR